MTVLVIDNYDSFTWNLVQLVGALGHRPHVVRNDAISVADVVAMAPSHILLSPGPGHPEDPSRTGICKPVIDALGGAIPILGVCLGHQLVVCAFGGRVVFAPEVMHGKTSLVHHEGDGILRELPRPFEAMRYHSIVADPEHIPTSLRVTSWCKDGTIMSVRHVEKPVYGVQFHPESIGTSSGPALLASFLKLPHAGDSA